MRIHPILPALLAAFVLAGAGCRKAGPDAAHTHDHDHGHGHDPEAETRMARITAWTDRYEVFAEHPAPVARQATPFATHLTDRRTGEPRRDGVVKFILRQGTTTAEHLQAGPARPGIYLPRLTFPQPGDWRLSLVIPADDAGTNATVELGTVKVHADPAAAARAELPEAPEGVTFPKEQQWKILCQSEPVTRRRLVQRLRLPARVRARPGQAATVTAPVSGQLVAAPGQPLPRPGQRVEAGQVLAWLKPNFSEAGARLAEAQAAFATARAGLEQAEAAFERTQKLAAEQAKSVRELQEARLARETARARHAAATRLLATFRPAGEDPAATGLLLLELRAPITGILHTLAAGPGETVAAHQPVAALLDPATVWIEAGVPEASLARLGEAREAAVELPGQPRTLLPITGNGRGQLLALGLEVDPVTRTVPLLYETANPGGVLRVGQSLTLLVETGRTDETPAVPDDALVEEGDQWIVFVQRDGETFERREILPGIRDAGFVQVLQGVREGERVVARGARAIRVSSLTGALPAHGHTH